MEKYQTLLFVLSVFGAQRYVTCDFHTFNYREDGLHHFNYKSTRNLYCSGARLIGIVANCLEAEGATKEDANDLFAVTLSGSGKAKCFRACVMKECKFMDASGNFDRPMFRKYFSRFSRGDRVKEHHIGDVIEKCLATAKVEGNACDTVDDYTTCIVKNCKDCGLDLFGAFDIQKF